MTPSRLTWWPLNSESIARNILPHGRPFVNRAVLHLPNGKQFTVSVDNLSDANGYVGSVRLNGKPLVRTFIRHEAIMAGGELHFVMQSQPNTQWGTSQSSRPFSQSTSR